MNKRRLSSVLIAVILLFNTGMTFAGPIDEKQKELDGVKGNIDNTRGQIEGVKGEQDDVVAQLSNLEQDLEKKKTELAETERELAETQEQIETTKEELDEAIEKAEVHKELMEERLCAMYMSSNTSYLEVLFESRSFTDLLDRLVMVREIASLDREVLEEMQALQEQIEEKKSQLEEQRETVERAKVQIVSQKEEIEEKQKEREALLEDLKGRQKDLEAGLQQLEQDSKDLEGTIQKLVVEREEEERKRREEEARKRKEAEEGRKKKTIASRGNKPSGSKKTSGNEVGAGTNGGSIEKPKPADAGGSSTSENTSKGGAMTWPVPGHYHISSPYGNRRHPVTGGVKFHSGIDISGGGINGKSAVAAQDGTVILAQYYGGYGNCVIVDHGGGITTLYGHGSSIPVSVGQRVTRGQTVLKVGSTGVSTGPHLHFEVRVNGSHTNPMNYLR